MPRTPGSLEDIISDAIRSSSMYAIATEAEGSIAAESETKQCAKEIVIELKARNLPMIEELDRMLSRVILVVGFAIAVIYTC